MDYNLPEAPIPGIKAICRLITGSVLFLLCSICLLVIPFSMVIMGGLYMDQCPRETYIPVYLVVGGSFGLIVNFTDIIQRLVNRCSDKEPVIINGFFNIIQWTLGVFLFAWFIAGNVWVFRIHQDFTDDDPTVKTYCEPYFYYFAFWITISIYIVFTAAILTICSLCCFYMCCPATFPDYDPYKPSTNTIEAMRF